MESPSTTPDIDESGLLANEVLLFAVFIGVMCAVLFWATHPDDADAWNRAVRACEAGDRYACHWLDMQMSKD